LKDKLFWLCTCTGIELMTAIGVTLYLVYLAEVILALISLVIFSKLIVFHFVIDFFDKRKWNKNILKIHS
jgi:hypothetical protein